MDFTSHTALAQSTVDVTAPHMQLWPGAITHPVSLLVENVRTDKPAHFGSDAWGDVAEWDEPAEIDSKVTLTMPNGATMVMVAPELGDCFDPETTLHGYWDDYLSMAKDSDATLEAIKEMIYSALCDARNDAIDRWR